MPCYHPLAAGRMPGKTRFGKTPIRVFGAALCNLQQATLLLPCGQCIGCRLERSRIWAIRIMHQLAFHEEACFLTLTYDEKHVPKNGSLNKSELRTFFNDLRGRLSYNGLPKIKYFAVGEYGDQNQRPHYHAIIFGQSFQKQIADHHPAQAEPSRSGGAQSTHGLLSDLWEQGLHRISEVSFESAAYVARYSLKKVTGALAANHYGERVPEFLASSHGIGKGHFDAWKHDIYPSDQIVLPGRGISMPPKYYDALLEKTDPALYQKVKLSRAERETPTRKEYDRALYEKYLGNQVKKLTAKNTLKRTL